MLLVGAGVISIYKALVTVHLIQIMTKNKIYNLRVKKNQKKIIEILEFFGSYGVEVKK